MKSQIVHSVPQDLKTAISHKLYIIVEKVFAGMHGG